ncbi:cytochrome P450 [Streptomyces sp. NPDC088725]|uniref:cytochrome P450 n=1 Tax=Streptomyces sp. NPDC088725 TaxID=3365873 RepID=UPI0037F87A49
MTTQQQQPIAYPFPPSRLEVHPKYAELRGLPLSRVQLPYGEAAWLVTSHADVKAVLSDSRFSLAAALGRDQPRLRPTARNGGGLFSKEPPEHTRLRSLVAKEFSARRVEGLRVRAEALADQLLDAMEAKGEPADLVDDFAIPLPTTIICELLGIPGADHRRLWDWAQSVLSNTSTEEALMIRGRELFSYLSGVLDLRSKEPGDDVLSGLVKACDEDEGISQAELLALTSDLLIAGFVSTTNQIGNFFYQLLSHPADLAHLRDHPEAVPRAVEELMRYVPLLVGFTLPRYATEDVELGGVLIREGEAVLVATAAANRDPEIFPDPEEMVLDRPANPHVGFGHGVHYCIGAHLARLELQVALESVLRRMPGLRLAVPEDELSWKTDAMIIGLNALPVGW